MKILNTQLKRLEAMELQKHHEISQHIKIDGNKSIIYENNQVKLYIPSTTGELFHADNSFVRCIMGPYGSGKSTLAINEIVRRACAMPRWADGHRRRSRWGIVRNTSGELQTTTLKTWLDWFGGLGDIHHRQKPLLTYEHRFNDGHGIVELELLFIALDRPDDVRKIKSLELTGCYINEVSEIPQAILAHMKGRVNRYPSHGIANINYWSGIIADTNPPDEDHWINKDFNERDIPGYKLFTQPPGLLRNEDTWVRNPHADNANNLSPEYYTSLATGQNEEFIKVFCLGKFGTVGTGKLVFTDFNPDMHACEGLKPIQGESLIIGWDFGLCPACVVMQLSPRGQLLVLKEYVGDGIGIRTFAESIVIPGIAKDFPMNKIGISVADPAGNARSEIMEEMSCIGELNSLGIDTIAARTNAIPPRLGAIRYFLNRNMDGKPCFMIDKRQCPTLYKGFAKNYIYKRVAVSGEERYKDEPDKNMASHPMDACGYGCLEIASDRIIKDKMGGKEPVDMWNPIARIC